MINDPVLSTVSPKRTPAVLKELQEAAPFLNTQLHILEVKVAKDLERAFKRAAKARVGSLAMTPDPAGLFMANRKQILRFVDQNRLPAMYPMGERWRPDVLWVDQLDNYRRAAVYVDKILKGRTSSRTADEI